MSRADLSRKLGMSFPAVSSNVKVLLDAGYIREIGEGNNPFGRKSTMLSFNADRGYIVGVDVDVSGCALWLQTSLGEVIASAHDKSRPHGMVKNICRLVREAVQKEWKKPEQCCASVQVFRYSESRGKLSCTVCGQLFGTGAEGQPDAVLSAGILLLENCVKSWRAWRAMEGCRCKLWQYCLCQLWYRPWHGIYY